MRVRVPRGGADRVLLRYARDGEPRTVEAIVDEETEDETWWRATFPVCEPGDALPLAADRRRDRLRLADRQRASRRPRSPPATTSCFSLVSGPDWHLDSVVYEIFPDRFAASGVKRTPPEWAVPRAWSESPTGRGPSTAGRMVRRRPARRRAAARSHRVTRCERRLPDADLPRDLHPSLRRDDLRPSRSAARRRRGVRSRSRARPTHAGSGSSAT